MFYFVCRTLLVGVGYTVVKNAFFAVVFLGQFFCIPFNLSQHETTKFSVGVQEKSVQRPLVTLYLLFVMGVDLSQKSIKNLLF